MEPGLAANPSYLAVIGLLCGLFGFRVGWRTKLPALLPLVQGLVGFVAFATAWRAGGAIASAVAVGGWAIGTTLLSLYVFARDETIDDRVIGARRYREFRFAALTSPTGRAPWSWSRLARDAGVTLLFAVAAATTVNLVSLVIGAALLNTMNAWVAVLLRSMHGGWIVRLLVWDGWNLVRATSLVMLGSGLAAPLAARLGYPAPWYEVRWLLGVGGIGLVLGPVLRLLLAGTTGRLLGRTVHLGPRDGGG
ncbi:MAG TPA: hypothetical protein VD788_04360 [Candidatus Polarisedimenticolaceae bacterium]|nr:hypothetical protein [Candidatus Polarisedimenticolaceae bacterium]